jgi:sugar O-acyltransferase (sialic acid O-acetyltransferase NeuD family)
MMAATKSRSADDHSIYIVGSGGHARVVADILIAAGQMPTAFIDEPHAGESRLGLPVIGAGDVGSDVRVIVAIGDNEVRERVAQDYHRFATAIHPRATIAPDLQIGCGTVIMAGVVLSVGVSIGNHCIVNTHASIDHDVVLDEFVHVGPGATLGGSVRVGRASVVSLGANIIHGRTIGRDTIIGAGAVVLRDVPERVVAVGVPATVIRSRKPGDRYL